MYSQLNEDFLLKRRAATFSTLGSSALESGVKIFLTRIWTECILIVSVSTEVRLLTCLHVWIDASSVFLGPDSIVPQKHHVVCTSR